MPEITMDEYLAEISRFAQEDVSGAMTAEEIGAAMGWGECKTHKMVKQYVRAGQLEVVRVQRPAITGVMMKVYAYKPPQSGSAG